MRSVSLRRMLDTLRTLGSATLLSCGSMLAALLAPPSRCVRPLPTVVRPLDAAAADAPEAVADGADGCPLPLPPLLRCGCGCPLPPCCPRGVGLARRSASRSMSSSSSMSCGSRDLRIAMLFTAVAKREGDHQGVLLLSEPQTLQTHVFMEQMNVLIVLDFFWRKLSDTDRAKRACRSLISYSATVRCTLHRPVRVAREE